MTLGGVISMKYEDSDILAFISNKTKPISAPEKGAGSDKNAGPKESPENEAKVPENKYLVKDLLPEASGPDSLPAFEEFPVPSAEAPMEVDPQNSLNGGSNTGANTDSNTDSNTAVQALSGLLQAVLEPASSFSPAESSISRLSEKDELPFEAFDGYDSETTRVTPSLDDAFGIVTTGIEPLEITPSGATITGYIASARRSEIRLGTYVVVPYDGGEKLLCPGKPYE